MLMKKLDLALEATLADTLQLKKDDLVEKIDRYYEKKKKKGFYKRFKLMSRLSAERLGREFELLMRLRQIIFFFVFLFVVTMLALRPHSPYTSPLFVSLKKRLLDKYEFDKVVSVPQMWDYLDNLFGSAFFWEHWYYPSYQMKNSSGDDTLSRRANKLLGVPRIKQLMVRNDSCIIHSYFKRMFLRCYGQFNTKNEDRKSFGPGNGTAWVHSPHPEGSSYYWGRRDWYHGGGYIQDLSYKREKTLELVQYLKDNLWIRRGTRVVFVEWATYNVNLNLFCWFRLAFEMPPTGGVLTSYSIDVINLLRYLNPIDFLDRAFELILFFFLVYYTFELIRDIMHHGWKYFTRFWLYIDLMSFTLGYGTIILLIIRNESVKTTLEQIVKNPEKYSNLDFLANIQSLYIYFLALLLFFTYVKVFQFLDFSTSMNQLRSTLSRCKKDVGSFAIMFLIIYIAFAVLGYLLFGMEVDTFSSVPVSTLTLLRTILVDFDYSSIDMANRVIAPIYFIGFIFLVFFVLLNMYLAIINDTYGAVKTELMFAPESMQMISFLKRGVHNLLLKFHCIKPGAQNINLTNFRTTKKEILEVFSMIGISDDDIKEFLKSYTIHPTNEIEQREINVLMAAVGGTLDPRPPTKEEPKPTESSHVEPDVFQQQQARLDPIEDAITQLTQDIYTMYDMVKRMEKGGDKSDLQSSPSLASRVSHRASTRGSSSYKASDQERSTDGTKPSETEPPTKIDKPLDSSKVPDSTKISDSSGTKPTGTQSSAPKTDSKLSSSKPSTVLVVSDSTNPIESSRSTTPGTKPSKKTVRISETDQGRTIETQTSSTKPISSKKSVRISDVDQATITTQTKPTKKSVRISDTDETISSTKSESTQSSSPSKKTVRLSESVKRLEDTKPFAYVKPSEQSRTSEDISELSYASLASDFTKLKVSTMPSRASIKHSSTTSSRFSRISRTTSSTLTGTHTTTSSNDQPLDVSDSSSADGDGTSSTKTTSSKAGTTSSKDKSTTSKDKTTSSKVGTTSSTDKTTSSKVGTASSTDKSTSSKVGIESSKGKTTINKAGTTSSKVDTNNVNITSNKTGTTSSNAGTTSSKTGTTSSNAATTSSKSGTTSSKPDSTSSKVGTTSSTAGTTSSKADSTISKAENTTIKADSTSSKAGTTSSKAGTTSSKADTTSTKTGTTSSKAGTTSSKATSSSGTQTLETSSSTRQSNQESESSEILDSSGLSSAASTGNSTTNTKSTGSKGSKKE